MLPETGDGQVLGPDACAHAFARHGRSSLVHLAACSSSDIKSSSRKLSVSATVTIDYHWVFLSHAFPYTRTTLIKGVSEAGQLILASPLEAACGYQANTLVSPAFTASDIVKMSYRIGKYVQYLFIAVSLPDEPASSRNLSQQPGWLQGLSMQEISREDQEG